MVWPPSVLLLWPQWRLMGMSGFLLRVSAAPTTAQENADHNRHPDQPTKYHRNITLSIKIKTVSCVTVVYLSDGRLDGRKQSRSGHSESALFKRHTFTGQLHIKQMALPVDRHDLTWAQENRHRSYYTWFYLQCQIRCVQISIPLKTFQPKLHLA